jgi:hypothetical protein
MRRASSRTSERISPDGQAGGGRSQYRSAAKLLGCFRPAVRPEDLLPLELRLLIEALPKPRDAAPKPPWGHDDLCREKRQPRGDCPCHGRRPRRFGGVWLSACNQRGRPVAAYGTSRATVAITPLDNRVDYSGVRCLNSLTKSAGPANADSGDTLECVRGESTIDFGTPVASRLVRARGAQR